MLINLRRLVGRACKHQAIGSFDHWSHSRSGDGYWVSECKRCGAEMTQLPAGRWQPIALENRP